MSRKYLSKKNVEFISSRAQNCCEYCKCLKKYSPQPFVREHIIPISLGGSDDLDNLAYACGGCNGHKYNKVEGIDLVNSKTVPLFHPRNDEWTSHFTWDDEFLCVIGKTSVGRATVNTLKLNRQELINIRKITLQTGDHPPENSIR